MPQNTNTRRIKATEFTESQFYKMPKFLIQHEKYRGLSAEAKILYMLMRERHNLSILNGWVDTDGYIYLLYSRENMGEDLGLAKNAITKRVTELKDCGLIEEVRQGQGLTNRLYVNTLTEDMLTYEPVKVQGVKCKRTAKIQKNDPATVGNVKTPQKGESRVPKKGSLDSLKSTPNNTNTNNTKSELELPHSFKKDGGSEGTHKQYTESNKSTSVDISQYAIICENTKVDTLGDYPEYRDIIEMVRACLYDMCTSEYTTIKGDSKHKQTILGRLFKLNEHHLEYAILSYMGIIAGGTDIKNKGAYLKSLIYMSLVDYEERLQY